MQIYCTHCHALIHADDVNLDRLVAKCRACQAVFAFSPGLAGPAQPEPARERPRAPRPEDVSEAQLPDGLTLTWHRRVKDGGTLIFVFHLIFGVFFAVMALSIAPFPFFLPFVAGGAFFSLNAIHHLFLATVLTLSRTSGGAEL